MKLGCVKRDWRDCPDEHYTPYLKVSQSIDIMKFWTVWKSLKMSIYASENPSHPNICADVNRSCSTHPHIYLLEFSLTKTTVWCGCPV
jgi:hypothetical protein